MSGAWIEVDRRRLLGNLAAFRSHLGAELELMAVVKANAYGHGAAIVAPAIRDEVDWYGVDALSEAEELASLGLDRPVLVLGHTEPSDAERIVRSDFRQALFRRDVAEALSQAAKTTGRTARVHLKIETGLHRLGVAVDELEGFAELLSGLDGIELEGVYTHFADVENPRSVMYREQLHRFRQAIAILRTRGLTPSVVHASPTAGVLLYQQADLTLGRLGIGLYGIWPSRETKNASPALALEPVLSWKCRIAQVKTVPAGATVGYDLTYQTDIERRIAVIPVGYYDGLDRKLSNKGFVLVRGRRAPIVGRIAMNMSMVDVSGIDAREGDEVVLIGEQGGGSITADEMAEWAGTIAYEVVARLGAALPRQAKIG